MSWFLNHYKCARCGSKWTDEWSCMCDDDCPSCGARHMSPDDSEDLTYVIARREQTFAVLYSPDTAEHNPDYDELAAFPTRRQARAYLAKTLSAATE